MTESDKDFKILLTIEDTFYLEVFGVVLKPNFSVPKTTGDQSVEFTALIKKASGDEATMQAELLTVHYNIRDPEVSIDTRWRIEIRLPNASKEDIPIGAELYAPVKIVDLLLGKSS